MAKKTKVNITIQYKDKDINTNLFVEQAKDIWKTELGKKVSDMSVMSLYIKPEENTVYYVMDDEKGSFEI